MLQRANQIFHSVQALTEYELLVYEGRERGHLGVMYGPKIARDLIRPSFDERVSWSDSQLYWGLKRIERQKTSSQIPAAGFLKEGTSLGVKLAGIHWQIANPVLPRGAERTAGYTEYDPILAVVKAMGASLTFTCMEMSDNEDAYPSYSRPKSLVGTVAEIAALMDLPLYGENALSVRGNRAGFENIRSVFNELDVYGFTLLRWQDLLDEHGKPTENARWYQEHILYRVKTKIRFRQTVIGPKDLALSGHRLVLVALGEEDLGNGDPEKGVPMNYDGFWTWSTHLDLNDAGRLRYRVFFKPGNSAQVEALTPWYSVDNSSAYLLESPEFTGFVLDLPPLD